MFPGFDPSKVDPQVLMKLSELVRQLPPDKIMKMQSLMHNMMAGFDVKKEMEEFERTLPPFFREQMMQIMMGPGGSSLLSAAGAPAGGASPSPAPIPVSNVSGDSSMSVREARLMVLRALRSGEMEPEMAYGVLFPEE